MSRAWVAPALVVGRRVALVACFVVILLRPGFGEATAPSTVPDVELLVVLDRTKSMDAADMPDGLSRLEAATRDLSALVEALPGVRVGLVTTATRARTEIPFSSDQVAFDTALDTMRAEGAFIGSGSRVDRPFPVMEEVLADAAAQHPERRRVVVFAGDGEDTSDDEQPADFGDVARWVDAGVVLGYGTPEGARLPIEPGRAERPSDFLIDLQTGAEAISRLDEEALQQVAEQLDVDYARADELGLDGLVEVASGFEGEPVPDPNAVAVPSGRELTWLFGGAVFVLGLFELGGTWRGTLLALRERRRR